MPRFIRSIAAASGVTVSEYLLDDGQQVAIKTIDRQQVGPFRFDHAISAAQRWMELSSRAELANKHGADVGLVRYLSVDVAQGHVVMELMRTSLASRLVDGPSDTSRVLQYMRSALQTLVWIHDHSLVHSNLKPSNIFFDIDGRIQLSDGFLVPLDSRSTLPPPTSRKYLAPEHANDQLGPLGIGTDLYLVGFIALEMLVGSAKFGTAFPGVGENAGDDDLSWFQWHGSPQPAPAAASLNPSCATEVASVIDRLLAKSPQKRFLSARDALAALPLTAEARRADGPAAPSSVDVHQPLMEHIRERPTGAIVLEVASGPLAGKTFGTEETDFLVGFDSDCLVRFSVEEYPTNHQTKLRIRRDTTSWIVERVAGLYAFVNQSVLETTLPLKSSDVVRLSINGPDIQFSLQASGASLRQIADRYLKLADPSPKRPARDKSSAPASAPAARPSGNQNAPLPPSAAPQPRPAVAAPAPPPPPRAAAPVAPSAPPAPPIPAKPIPAAPVRAQVVPSDGGAAPKAPSAPKSQARSVPTASSFNLFSPASWTKNQTNLITAVLGSIVVVILVILFPTSKPEPEPASTSGDSTATQTAPQPTNEGQAPSAPTTPPENPSP